MICKYMECEDNIIVLNNMFGKYFDNDGYFYKI